VSGSDVYAGGRFFSLDFSSTLNKIAKWDGSSWSGLGDGISGNSATPVLALAVSGSNLYAGGNFFPAIAKWDGGNWSYLDSGNVNLGLVYALAVSGNDLYAGGSFYTASGSIFSNVAKWDGSNWSALGLGINGSVRALAVSGSNVYAGGIFQTAGGIAANNIAKWDGSNWSALGSGMNDSVYALAVSGSDLYAGGDFTTATNSGGIAVPANRVAKWDGSNWSALGSGMNSNRVYALVVSGSNVYAGGSFTTAGSSAANGIAKWDGSDWSPMGSGVNNTVIALAVSGTDLYVGGQFTTAGGKVSAYVAKALLNGLPLVFASDGLSVSNGFFYTLLTGPENESVVLDCSSDLNTWTAVATNNLPSGGWPISLPIGTNQHQLYRARYGP